MIVAVDTHAHIYPCHDVVRLLEAASRNLRSLTRSAAASCSGRAEESVAHVLCLTERASERAFDDLSSRRALPTHWDVRPTDQTAALRLSLGGGAELVVLAGRQVVTAERLEALALGTSAPIPDGLPLAEALDRIRASGAIAVLPWSPGKWLGARGRVVRRLIESEACDRLLIGDTALRPSLLPEPLLLRRARRLGRRIVAGSDPLPLRGEERQVARYATILRGELDPARPMAALSQMLMSSASAITRSGRRRSPASVALALARLALAHR